MISTYTDAIDYLLSFADFERSGTFQRRDDLTSMLVLLHALGDPHLGRRTIHVAGSKGKGSTAAMIESVLRASGVRTGLYTSPHLHDYTERIRIDGEPISQADFARLTAQLKPALDRVREGRDDHRFVTFDLLTALGFLAFGDSAVEVQVVEVGLGGRLDSTNVFEVKDVAVITPLSLEHTHILGNTIEEIAAEKAAIIVPDCVAALGPQSHAEAQPVVRKRAEEAGARLIVVAEEYGYNSTPNEGGQSVRLTGLNRDLSVTLPLIGEHQAANAATALAAIDAFAPNMPDSAVSEGMASVRWPARTEVISRNPLVIADGAHNRDSARALRTALTSHFGAHKATFIIGSSRDKDITGLAEELAPIGARVLAVRSNHPRTMEPAAIVSAFAALDIPAEDVDTVPAAIERAMADAQNDALICLTGSLFVAAEGREYFGLS